MTPPASSPYTVVAWERGRVRLLDQTLLPFEVRYLDLRFLDDVAEAIEVMRVRGAPAIGITAAYGLALAVAGAAAGDARVTLDAAADRLLATRPTAVNLSWAIERVWSACEDVSEDAIPAVALTEAQRIHQEQLEADRCMAEAGAALLVPGARVLTHCNTGPLATAGLGTALGVVIQAHRDGRVAAVLVDETRPRLQGARLTAWELDQHAIPYEIIADGAAAAMMAAGRVDAVFVGADRIAANGDVANKIGTYALAIAARHHGLPFYVVAPLSTVDAESPSGAAIPIEVRAEDELLEIAGVAIAPPDAHAFNPAFDVTPAELVSAIITERGVLRPPYASSLATALLASPLTPPLREGGEGAGG